jgi:hypothetical protein
MRQVALRRTLEAGERFGMLTVIDGETTRPRPNGRIDRAARCRCDCGAETIVAYYNLVSRNTESCGHLAKPRGGLQPHPLYQTWAGILKRCENPQSKAYKDYGGRGIKIHPEWRDPARFIAWIEANIGPRPEGRTPGGKPLYSLDRIDVNGNYEPGNVRWATIGQQAANKRVHALEAEVVRLRAEVARLQAALLSGGQVIIYPTREDAEVAGAMATLDDDLDAIGE